MMKEPKNSSRSIAATLVELLIAAAAAAIIGGAIIGAMISLQRTFLATESYSMSQATQMRLLDCVATDLRRSGTNSVFILNASGSNLLSGSYAAVGISGSGPTSISTGTLAITIPAFYSTVISGSQSNPSPESNLLAFDANRKLTYIGKIGTSSYSTILVTYRKTYLGLYGSQCYVRQEDLLVSGSLARSGSSVIATNAEGLLLEAAAGTGLSPESSYKIRTRFSTLFQRTGLPPQPKISDPSDGLGASETVTRRTLF